MPTSRRRKKKSVRPSSRKATKHGTLANIGPDSDMTERSIEFAAGYCKSGAEILAYFAEILKQKRLDNNAKVRIEQENITVRIRIESPAGEVEVIEAELSRDELTIAGQEYLADGSYSNGFQQPNNLEATVVINLPQATIDALVIERIRRATGSFMEALGFELVAQDEPIFGSFFQRLLYVFRGSVKEQAGEFYAKGKQALEVQHISLPAAEATNQLTIGAATLITSLSGVDNAALRLGAILLVKVTRDGVQQVVTETISLELAALLDKNPALLQNPSIVFDLISGMRLPDKTIGESGSIKLFQW